MVSPKRSNRRTAGVTLRPRDPFDLIRLLARSQSDPRKAIAELVQNSLDAGAHTVEITWFTEKRRRAISILDDGEGVFPEMEREEALRHVARTIGYSHKRDLTPAARREQMVLGKYGIGLIGFWSVGEVMEVRSRVGGGRAHVLRLREESSRGEVFLSRARAVGPYQTFTEVTIRNLHEAALNKIRPVRLQAYLANELRGQLLERSAVVHIRDRVARGRARKVFAVEPRPYLGKPLPDLTEMEVPGFDSARVEVYLVMPEEERLGVVALSCGGTVVLDDIAEIDGVGAPREPWSTGRFEGVIDFPDLSVSPGSRRGFSHDEPVAAFLEALGSLESELLARLKEERRRRAEQHRESLAREIRRAFLSVARQLPEYELFGVSSGNGDGRAASVSGGEGADSANPVAGEPLGTTVVEPAEAKVDASADSGGPADEETAASQDAAAEPELFPPGPPARLVVRPKRLSVAPRASRSLSAYALDAEGRRCDASAISWTWRLTGAGVLVANGSTAAYTAPDIDRREAGSIAIHLRAEHAEVCLEAVVAVQLSEDPALNARVGGIPDPIPVAAPGQSWRSRMRGDRWEYNESHCDYLVVAESDARRLRYLIHLFAKEIVVRNFGAPGSAETLERMVEVLTRLDPGGRR